MEKTATVTKVTKFDKKDDYGNSSFALEFDNGDKGFFRTKNENQNYFTSGKPATYLIEEKEGKEGKKYFKISRPQADGQKWQGKKGGWEREPFWERAIGFAASYAKDLVVAGKSPLLTMEEEMNRIYEAMMKIHASEKDKH